MPDGKISNLPSLWMQDTAGKFNLVIRQYLIVYKGKEMAVITDFNMGFMNLVKRLNPEITVKEID